VSPAPAAACRPSTGAAPAHATLDRQIEDLRHGRVGEAVGPGDRLAERRRVDPLHGRGRIPREHEQFLEPGEKREPDRRRVRGAEGHHVAGDVHRLLRAGRAGGQPEPHQPSGLTVPDEPLHQPRGRAGERGRRGPRIDDRFRGEPLGRRQTRRGERAVEPAGERLRSRAGRRQGRAGRGVSTPSPAFGERLHRGRADGGGRVGHEGRREQKRLHVLRAAGLEGIDDPAPVPDVARAQPCQQRLPGLGPEVADEATGEVARAGLRRIVRLQDLHQGRQRRGPRRGQLLRGRAALGGRVRGQRRGGPREPLRIATAGGGRVADRGHEPADRRLAVAQVSFQPGEVGAREGVAKVGEQFNAAFAGVADRLPQPPEVGDGHVGHVDGGNADRGLEQLRRRVARR
jgi:hypothetical protein